MSIQKEEVRLSLFTEDILLYIENHITKKSLISEFSKAVRYKINTQTSITYISMI